MREQVKRFDPLSGYDSEGQMYEVEDGEWVRYSDYMALRERVQAAEEATEMAVCHAFSAGYEAGQRDANDPPYKADGPTGQTRLP